jgi:hypothetical protein
MILYTSRRDAPFWILLVFGSALIISSITFFILGETIFYKGIMPSEKGFRFSSGL